MSDARWYTAARRFPQLIGRTPDGSKLPGGPYTILQLVVGAVVLFVLWNTTGLWARGGLFVNIAIGGGLLCGSVWLSGRLPYNLRNPLVVVGGWWHAIERAGGTAGRAADVRLRKPRHPANGQVLMLIPDDTPAPSRAADEIRTEAHEPALDVPAVSESASVDPVIAPHRGEGSRPSTSDSSPIGPALSGVQRLLASAGSSTPRS